MRQSALRVGAIDHVVVFDDKHPLIRALKDPTDVLRTSFQKLFRQDALTRTDFKRSTHVVGCYELAKFCVMVLPDAP